MRDRLTEAQKRVLAIMLEFDCSVYIHWGRGFHSAFFGHPCPHKRQGMVRPRTVRALNRKELTRLITPKELRWRERKYELTESGRALAERELAAAEQQQR